MQNFRTLHRRQIGPTGRLGSSSNAVRDYDKQASAPVVSIARIVVPPAVRMQRNFVLARRVQRQRYGVQETVLKKGSFFCFSIVVWYAGMYVLAVLDIVRTILACMYIVYLYIFISYVLLTT